MSNVENVSIFTWRLCMAEMAIYFNGGFHETEQMVHGCANQGVIYSRSLDRCEKWMTPSLCGCHSTHTMSCGKIVVVMVLTLPAAPKPLISVPGLLILAKGTVCYLFRLPKYSVSKECRQLHISVEGPFFIKENSCSICNFSAFQSTNSCTPKQINLICCVTNKKLSWVAAVPCITILYFRTLTLLNLMVMSCFYNMKILIRVIFISFDDKPITYLLPKESEESFHPL